MSPTPIRRRVQRPVEQWPVVHLEEEIPEWGGTLIVDGLVRHSRALSLSDLAAFGEREHRGDLHCVWGWSKLDVAWGGVPVGAVLTLAAVDCPVDPQVIVASASGTYSSCLPLAEAARGFLAWTRDGQPIPAKAGGPLRFIAPPEYWAYKGVKWAARITITDHVAFGFWESKVEDPVGTIPSGVVVR